MAALSQQGQICHFASIDLALSIYAVETSPASRFFMRVQSEGNTILLFEFRSLLSARAAGVGC